MNRFPPLRALAPAKINLGLFVGPLRDDGKHQLVSVMQSISLADELVLEPAPEAACDELLCPGLRLRAEENLAMRAVRAFREATGWEDVPVRLRLNKRVPVAAGLGGGSGDAAAALRLAAAASGHRERETLGRIASLLGADVPAQVVPGRWLAQGAGERLSLLPDPRLPFGVLVLPDARPLSTASVYGELDRRGAQRAGTELAPLALALRAALADGEPLPARELLGNDLQACALSLCPSIAGSLERASAAGAQSAIVSGSGPTVIGLFSGPEGMRAARRAADALKAEGHTAHAARPVGAKFGAVTPLAVTQQ
jgi:4-diphosphocytidyl-2-C-methyl-D-erythritol kinase